jgi:hypothetical protein
VFAMKEEKKNGRPVDARRVSPAKLLGGAAGAFALGWGGYAAVTWLGYGHHRRRKRGQAEDVLDLFIPEYEAGDVHQVRVMAPPEYAMEALKEMDLNAIPLVRAIFRARELILRARPGDEAVPPGILASTLWMGWGVLEETPNAVVVGAVTRPWEADVHFHAVAPDEFRDFAEPGWVKIVWTLEAEPRGELESVARTRVGVRTTDDEARKRFRRYWSIFSPGIHLIRRLSLPAVKADAERRFRQADHVLLPEEPAAATA